MSALVFTVSLVVLSLVAGFVVWAVRRALRRGRPGSAGFLEAAAESYITLRGLAEAAAVFAGVLFLGLVLMALYSRLQGH